MSDQVAWDSQKKWPTKWVVESEDLWVINTYTEQEPYID